MTTARDIVSAALEEAGVKDIGDGLNPDAANSALKVLNRMLHGWKSRGVDLGHADYDMASTITILPEAEDATVMLLARRMVDRFPGLSASHIDADDAWRRVYALYNDIPQATFDDGLKRMPSQYGRGNFRSS